MIASYVKVQPATVAAVCTTDVQRFRKCFPAIVALAVEYFDAARPSAGGS